MFRNRTAAGRQLASHLTRLGLRDPLVLAIPRGGVPVAAEIARVLHAPLDLLLVRKIGAPQQPELAVAAVAEGGAIVTNEDAMLLAGVSRAWVAREAQQHLREIARRRDRYLAGRAPLPVAGHAVIIVDDGIATGATIRAALQLLRRQAPGRIVLAIPVASSDAADELRPLVDDLVCLETPEYFNSVGAHYAEFEQLDDQEVGASLNAVAEDR
jgi:putative phosphoribosyl transferase